MRVNRDEIQQQQAGGGCVFFKAEEGLIAISLLMCRASRTHPPTIAPTVVLTPTVAYTSDAACNTWDRAEVAVSELRWKIWRGNESLLTCCPVVPIP
jgi:hypothetical protein